MRAEILALRLKLLECCQREFHSNGPIGFRVGIVANNLKLLAKEPTDEMLRARISTIYRRPLPSIGRRSDGTRANWKNKMADMAQRLKDEAQMKALWNVVTIADAICVKLESETASVTILDQDKLRSAIDSARAMTPRS